VGNIKGKNIFLAPFRDVAADYLSKKFDKCICGNNSVIFPAIKFYFSVFHYSMNKVKLSIN
jgi:hypothetical protein